MFRPKGINIQQLKSEIVVEKQKDYYKDKLEKGQSFENSFEDFFAEQYGINLGMYKTKEEQYTIGENQMGIEIKYDIESLVYPNLYIEVAERTSTDKDYVASGIYRKDNSKFYLIGNNKEAFLIKKELLFEIDKGNYIDGIPKLRDTENVYKTSLGFLITKKDVLKHIEEFGVNSKILHFQMNFEAIDGIAFYKPEANDNYKPPRINYFNDEIPSKQMIKKFLGNSQTRTM